MLQAIKHNWLFILVFFLYGLLGYFDATEQNRFLTENFRLPFFNIAVLSSFAWYVYTYTNAQLCPTQSSNYQKLALGTIGYGLVSIVLFSLAKDPNRFQLFIYAAGIVLALIFYFHKDTRLQYETNSNEYFLAFKAEKKWAGVLFIPLFLVLILLQIVESFFVNTLYQIYFNPVEQIAFGTAITIFCFTLVRTRLDNFKHLLLIIEILLLLLSGLYFIYIALTQLDISSLTNNQYTFQFVKYAFVILYITILNLAYGLLQTYKGWYGAIIKFATLFGYVNLFFISFALIYH